MMSVWSVLLRAGKCWTIKQLLGRLDALDDENVMDKSMDLVWKIYI